MSSSRPSSVQSVSASDLGILLFLGAVWGSAFLSFRVASPEVGPLWVAEARVGLAALVLLAVAGRRSWVALRGRLVAVAITGALFSAIPFSLIAFASLTLPASFGPLVNAVTPLFTALLGAAVLGVRLSGRVIVGIGVGMAAVALLVGWSPIGIGPDTIVAVVATLGASLSYAAGGTFVRRTLHGVGGVDLATGQLTSAALLILPFALLSGAPGVPSPAGVAAMLSVAIPATAVAWPLFFRVLARTTPTAASTATFVVPAFGMLWGALFLGEPIGPELIAGFAMILVSLVLVLGLPVGELASGTLERLRDAVRRAGQVAGARLLPRGATT
jgi:drug/metabolite transporter (DMT)-like permease